MGAGFGEELNSATHFLGDNISACQVVGAGVCARARKEEGEGRAHTKFVPAGSPRSGVLGEEAGAEGPGRRWWRCAAPRRARPAALGEAAPGARPRPWAPWAKREKLRGE